MTEVVVQSSSTRSTDITSSTSPTRNDALYQQVEGVFGRGGERRKRRRRSSSSSSEEESDNENEEVVNFVGLFLTVFRRSVLGYCSSSSNSSSFCCLAEESDNNKKENNSKEKSRIMEIGLPTNVRHVAHVTFDRFNGFLGLPVEFEPEVPPRAPSASTTVFGVSTNSMQLSFDSRGNSVPTILLMMQSRLYELGGLQAEGIFRINAENGQEEYVRDQLNRGLVPDDVDIHCLAGLIKAWFRELPTGILDSLSPEQVMHSHTEEECVELSRLLPPTEVALLDWAINLMADVAQSEQLNKMNARNVAMVFAPNMTHMADPLTALMHAVQVMNFLKTLIERTIRERESSILDLLSLDPCGNGKDPPGENSTTFSTGPALKRPISDSTLLNIIKEDEPDEPSDDHENAARAVTPVDPTTGDQSSVSNHSNDRKEDSKEGKSSKGKLSQGSNKGCKTGKKGQRVKNEGCVAIQKVGKSGEKTKGSKLVSSVNPRTDRIEAWR